MSFGSGATAKDLTMRTKNRIPQSDGANFRMLGARLSRIPMQFPAGKVPVKLFCYQWRRGRTLFVYVPGCDVN